MLDDDLSESKPCPFAIQDILIVILLLALVLGVSKRFLEGPEPKKLLPQPTFAENIKIALENRNALQARAKAEAIVDCDEEPALFFDLNPPAD